jgi:hypothetical protein
MRTLDSHGSCGAQQGFQNPSVTFLEQVIDGFVQGDRKVRIGLKMVLN